MPNNPQKFRLRQLILPQIGLWLLAWLLGIAAAVSALGLTMTAGWFLTAATTSLALGVGFAIALPTLIIRVLAIVRTVGRYGDLLVSHWAVFGLLKVLRVRFFERWARLDFLDRQLLNQSSSQKTHRLVKDIDVLNEFTLRFVSPWIVAAVSVATIVAAAAWLLPIAVPAAVLAALALCVAAASVRFGVSMASEESVLLEQRKSKLLDTLPALTQLLLWQRWQDEIAQIGKLDDAQTALMARTQNLRRATLAAMQLFIIAAVMLLLVQMRASSVMPALALAAVFVLFGLSEIFMNVAAEPLALGRSAVAKARLNALLETPKTAARVPLEQVIVNDKFTLSLTNLQVKAPSAIIATHPINAVITSESPCLITGASGAGKSTLLHTLAAEYPVYAGELSVQSGQNMQPWQQLDFGASLGFLGQAVDIFDQSLADNLRLGKPDASDDELYAALAAVNLLEWTHAQPQGLATPLGEYGAAVSGGQARRIALARLLLAPKRVLLLDEPFAGLDALTRQVVWQSLTQMQKAGHIGLLLISTHQIWDEMGASQHLAVGNE